MDAPDCGFEGRRARPGHALGVHMTTLQSHFTFRVDTRTPDGETSASQASRTIRLHSLPTARSVNAAPTPITLRQGARVIEDSRCLRAALRRKNVTDPASRVLVASLAPANPNAGRFDLPPGPLPHSNRPKA